MRGPRGFLKDLRATSDHGAAALGALLVLAALFSLSLPISEHAARVGLERFHMRLSYPAWALLQLTPAMYNFENQWAVYEAGDVDPTDPLTVRWMNHHVTRVVYEVGRRWPLNNHPGCFRYVFRSAYQGQQLTTHYESCRSVDSGTFTIRRVEPEAR